MIFVKEAKGLRFVRFNKAGEELLGLKKDQLIGKNDYDFFPKKEADFFTRKDRAVLKSKKLLDIPEEPIHTQKKGLRILHTKKIPLMNAAGKPQYLLGISEDITDRKNKDLERKVEQRTRELRAAANELEAFSYSVSHDLRAPLRAIEGFSQILLEDHKPSLNAEGQRLLQVVRKNTLHMSQLIDDLLSFSRIARKEFIKRRVPMADLAHVVSEELQETTPGKKCACTIHPMPDAFGDTSLLRQVWTNLISNAIKFTQPMASPEIDISAEESAQDITYKIRDNGVGFDMQYANKLFGVFQRLHSTQEFEGTGVGLAIVQRIILRHGGRVWAEGKINAGATFYFSLPKSEELL